MKRALSVFIAISFLIISAPQASAGLLNEKAPLFALENVSGGRVSLESFRGKVVFIDFWATWCPPCKKELPELNKLSEKYKDADFALVAVNIDKKRSHVDSYLSGIPALSKNFHVLLDADASAISLYNAMAMPTSFVVDKTGVIRFIHFGYKETDPVKWSEEIDSLLK